MDAKFQIIILKNKKVIELLELWQLWLNFEKKQRKLECFTTQNRKEKGTVKTIQQLNKEKQGQ